MTTIYGLVDPRHPEEVRYVGKSVKSAAKRLAEHHQEGRLS